MQEHGGMEQTHFYFYFNIIIFLFLGRHFWILTCVVRIYAAKRLTMSITYASITILVLDNNNEKSQTNFQDEQIRKNLSTTFKWFQMS